MSKRKVKVRAAVPRHTVNGAELTGVEAQLWRTANDDLTAPDFERRKRGHGVLRRLEVRLEEDRDAEAVRKGIDETIGLARMRGEKVEVSKRGETRGRVRIRSRDGLETMEGSGSDQRGAIPGGTLLPHPL